jgi:predicted amidohydrolase YtcJ
LRNGARGRDVAIRGETIVAVGDPATIDAYVGGRTRVVDLDGRLLLPAFHDDEVRLLEGARSLDHVWLGDAETHEEILEIVRIYAVTHPELDVIRGRGWRYHVVDENRRGELESVERDRPVVLTSQDGRASWTNRAGEAVEAFPHSVEASELERAIDYLHRFGITSIRTGDPLPDATGLEIRVVRDREPANTRRISPWSASPDWMPTAGRTFPVRSLLDSGARLVFGSGWPYGTLDPLSGIYAVVTREDLDGRPEGGWDPAERLDVEAAVRAYTRGTIEVGALADLVVLSENLFKIPESRIAEVKVEMTLFGGRIVYQASGFGVRP